MENNKKTVENKCNEQIGPFCCLFTHHLFNHLKFRAFLQQKFEIYVPEPKSVSAKPNLIKNLPFSVIRPKTQSPSAFLIVFPL